MGKEIERKFLVKSDAYRALGTCEHLRQGFLSTAKERVVRVRIMGDKAFFTVKGISTGATRAEFEYEIPVADAHFMLDKLCEKPIIDKHRFTIPFRGFTWEVDEFHGENEGLVVAEIELPSEDAGFEKPDWIGEEVTYDARYFNSNLVKQPFKSWK
jgi:adenylate cyclase